MLRMLLFLICPAVACAEDAVGRLNIAGYRHREMCSATLVAPDRALTAAIVLQLSRTAISNALRI